MKRYITFVIFLILHILIPVSLFASTTTSSSSNTQMSDDALHVGVVVNTYNKLIDTSSVLLDDLKRYCNTFFIETDDERSYINALIPKRKMRSAYKEFTSAVNSGKSDEILSKEEAFLTSEELYMETEGYFPPLEKKGVREYVVAPRDAYFSEFVFKDRIPIQYERFESKKFDERALFEESHLVARLITSENDYDLLVIPSSVILSTTLIRLRLKVYNGIEDAFYTVCDKIVDIRDIDSEINFWVILLAEHLSSDNFALYDVETKDYSISLEIDGEKSTETGVLKKGEHKVFISSPGRVSVEFFMNFEEGKINTITFDLKKSSYKNLLINAQGADNAIVSIDGNDFLLPRHFDEFETPVNYKISALGFIPMTGSITNATDNMEYRVNLRPEWASNKQFVSAQMRKFYTAITVTLGLFAIDIGTRAFGNAGEKREMWASLNDMSKGIIYASLGVVFGSIVDYFVASKYALY